MDGSVRLHSAYSEWEGTVEVCISGVRGTVCDQSWDSRNADVVCRQLGYPTLGKIMYIDNHSKDMSSMRHLCTKLIVGAIPYSDSYFGHGEGYILLDNVRCSGSEQYLVNCTHSGIGVYSTYRCNHANDAGVQCLGWS